MSVELASVSPCLRGESHSVLSLSLRQRCFEFDVLPVTDDDELHLLADLSAGEGVGEAVEGVDVLVAEFDDDVAAFEAGGFGGGAGDGAADADAALGVVAVVGDHAERHARPAAATPGAGPHA